MPQLNKQAVSVSAFLSGKAQTDFWEWYLLPETLNRNKLTSQHKYSNGNAIKVCFLSRSKTEQNAIIMDWLDSVCIYITTKPKTNSIDFFKWQFSIRNYKNTPYVFYTRNEAYDEAIKEANIIYNAKHKDTHKSLN